MVSDLQELLAAVLLPMAAYAAAAALASLFAVILLAYVLSLFSERG